jgi:predicted methyltransferase
MKDLRIVLAAGLIVGVSLFLLSAPHVAIADKIVHQSALAPADIPAYITAAVNSPERPAADKARDASRKPAQVMAFFGVKPGMHVADLWAAGGYTTELLARIVGPSGRVYSQNPAFGDKFKDAEKAWQARMKEPGLTNVIVVPRAFDDPAFLPAQPGTLDLVIVNLNYHDMVDRKFDRTRINAAVFKALKPGGVYAIVDNSAQPGSGARDAGTLHRIDEQFEVREISDAGFRLVADSDILRNPKDDRTLPFWKMNHQLDRVILKFVKPEV